MKIQIVSNIADQVKNKLLVLPIFEETEPEINNPLILQFKKINPKFGKLNDSQLLLNDDQGLFLIGVGKAEKWNFEKLQNYTGTATKYALDKFKEIIIVLPIEKLTPEKIGEAAAIGIELATHDPSRDYKSEKEKVLLNQVQLMIAKGDIGFQNGIKKGQVIAEGINLVRRLADMPANEMTPTYFLSVAKKIAKDNKLKINIIDEKQARKLGMGGFVGVAQGSDEPSYIITLEYKGDIKSKDKWGLVGKGITFDSGGISIKPASNMSEMKYDMCGAGAVLAAMQVLAQLKVKRNILGVMCVTENLPGGKAQKPGDIVRLYNGKTAEVLNTDAEGRLVLVDGLTLAQKQGAIKLIDLATLTGACIVALGGVVTGAMGNNAKFTQDIIMAGFGVGEKIWELPMFEEYNEMIKSDFADMTNIGHSGPMPGAAGSISAAKFLEAVIEKDIPWVHLDIAGTAWDLKPRSFRGPGATGVGVKTLVELIGS